MLVASLGRRPGWIPAMGNSDAHNPGQVVALPQTVVRAERLDRSALLEGIQSGQSWIAESAQVELSLAATAGGRTAGIGKRISVAPDVPVDVEVHVAGCPTDKYGSSPTRARC